MNRLLSFLVLHTIMIITNLLALEAYLLYVKCQIMHVKSKMSSLMCMIKCYVMLCMHGVNVIARYSNL